MSRLNDTLRARGLDAPLARHMATASVLFAFLTGLASGQEASLSGISVDGLGGGGNDDSRRSQVSDDGRFVVFESKATNLDPIDYNDATDVFLFDREAASTSLVSRSSTGTALGTGASDPAISGDGLVTAFASRDANVVAGDTNGFFDVFVNDRSAGAPGTMERVSVGAAGLQADGDSTSPSLSSDGRYVAFASRAANLVAGDTNGSWDVFVHDRSLGTTVRVSLDDNGAQLPANFGSIQPSISADGNWVAFSSSAASVVAQEPNGSGGFAQTTVSDATFSEVYVRDIAGAQTFWGSPHVASSLTPFGAVTPSISGDGTRVAYSTDRTSVGIASQAIAKAFQFDIVLYDRANASQAVRLIQPAHSTSQFPGDSFDPDISTDGSSVVYWTQRQSFQSGEEGNFLDDVYRWQEGPPETTKLVSVRNAGLTTTVSDSDSRMPAVSADGREVVFQSWATSNSLVQNDVTISGVHVPLLADVLLWSEPLVYCTGSNASNGCQPRIQAVGSSSASSTSGFFIEGLDFPHKINAQGIPAATDGMLLYSVVAPTAFGSFQGGIKCVGIPTKRGPAASGVLTGSAPACSSQNDSVRFSLDMNQFAAGLGGGNPKPELAIPGHTVWCQWWARDPLNSNNWDAALSNGIEYVVGF